MYNIKSLDIKEKFLKFFEDNNHLIIKNSSIIPKNDPTLLFINSGMAPLKRYFTGEDTPPSKKLCNIQPCIRTIDIDQIGDKHHLTSFQMLGSWSIGDYFKKDAINLAFDFLTNYINIPKDKLYVTIFGGDQSLNLEEDSEARQYWLDVGIPNDHIIACPREDNFWGPTSETGPCGPCTEVFFDTGDQNGPAYIPGQHFDTKNRYIEIWNAGVFMQFNKNADNSYSKLKFKSVDTGAGLERLAMVLNNKTSVYETDLLKPIKDKIIQSLKNSTSIPVKEILIMTDHLRTACLILSEKVIPSNEGRGYIPRKLIRKCILIITKSNIFDFNFKNILEFIIDSYKDIFPNFSINKNFILDTFQKEYDQFIKVITTGLEKLKIIKNSKKEINASDLFDLVTTFGLPFDIIKDFATDNNLPIDEPGFNQKILQHKNISKKSKKLKDNLKTLNPESLHDIPPTSFKGYQNFNIQTQILSLLDENFIPIKTTNENDNIAIILKETVFYAESGGQCSDIGSIYNDQFKIDIFDVQKTPSNIYIHFGKLISGKINIDDFNPLNRFVTLDIDKPSRLALSNNHSCVHLLHAALRSLYGQELHQAGSKVEKEKFRFDFNYDNKILNDDIFKIENIVNNYIRMNIKVKTEIKPLDEAIKDRAIALFENKYSDNVRVVSISNISKELCGGTHTSYTGNIGLFIILSVEGIGKGIKRITAITGQEAIKYIQSQSLLIKNISNQLDVKPDKIIEKISTIQKHHLNNLKTSYSSYDLAYQTNETKSGTKYAIIFHDEFNKILRDNIISIADKINGFVVYIGGKTQKQLLIASSKTVPPQYSANKILSIILSNISSGKGGGSHRIASGGGISVNNEKITSIIKNL